MSDIHFHLARETARQREVSQASARPSRVRFTVRTVGTGESRLLGQAAVKFGASMMEEPSFSYGLIATEGLAPGEMPIGSAIVLRYIIQNGLWIGAEMGFKVESAKYNIKIKWSLTYESSTLRTTAGLNNATQTVHGVNTYSPGTVGGST